MTTNKYVFFNTIEEAQKFVSLYGGISSKDYSFTTWRFGNKVDGKPYVYFRASKEDMKRIKELIGLKEKRFNNKICYVFE